MKQTVFRYKIKNIKNLKLSIVSVGIKKQKGAKLQKLYLNSTLSITIKVILSQLKLKKMFQVMLKFIYLLLT